MSNNQSAVQNLFQMVNVRDLPIYQLLKIRWVRWPVWQLSEVRNICLHAGTQPCVSICAMMHYPDEVLLLSGFSYLTENI